MSEQITAQVPSLSGGISKQPAHERFPGQVEDASNADFSIADGCSKRAGSRFVKVIAGLTAGSDYRIHAIARDNAEQYLVIYGNVGGSMTVKVVDDDGVGATMSPTPAATTYLANGSPSVDQIRMATIADTTFIVNSKVSTSTIASAEYATVANYRDDEVMFSYQIATGTYTQTSRDSLSYPRGYWLYTATDGLCGYATTSAVSTSTWGTHNNSAGYQAAASNPGGMKVESLNLGLAVTGITWNPGTLTLTKASAWSSILFRVVNGVDQILITGGTGVTTGWYTITTMGASSIVLASSISGGSPTNVTSSGVGRVYELSVNFTGETITDMYDIALIFQRALRAAGCTNGLINWNSTGVNSGYFLVVNGYTGAESSVIAISAPATGFNYSAIGVAFKFNSTTVGTGTPLTPSKSPASKWSRAAGPGQSDARPDPTTMPIKMVRTVVGPPATFTIDTVAWNSRLSGEEANNPVPELIDEGRKITDVAFFQNRLGLFGDEKILFTADGDFAEVYKYNANNIVDSDPIERSLTSNEVTVIDFAVPFRDLLVLFTRSGRQFELSSRDAFTPASVRIDATTSYDSVQNIRPRVSHGLLHFVAQRERETILIESRYNFEAAATAASEVTAHVERLLPAGIKTIAASPNNSVVALLPTSGQTLYVYNYFIIGDEKRQSAWSKYTFDASYRLVDIAVLRNHLYILAETGVHFVLEKIPIARPADDTGVGYSARLDRGMSITGVHALGTTTWTLPGGLSDTTITRAVLATGTATGSAGDEITVTNASTTVTKAGNYSGAAAIVGRPFTMSVELTRPFRKDFNGRSDIQAWLQHREITLAHKDSGSYTLRGTMANRTDRTKTFSPVTGLLEVAGKMRANFNGRADQMRVFVENATAKPCTIASVQYRLDYVPRY